MQTIDIPNEISTEGITIPITYARRKMNKHFFATWTNWGGSLTLYQQHIEYSVIFKIYKKVLHEIAQVDVYRPFKNYVVIIYFKDETNFMVHIPNKTNVKRLLHYFQQRDVPLSLQAQQLLG